MTALGALGAAVGVGEMAYGSTASPNTASLPKNYYQTSSIFSPGYSMDLRFGKPTMTATPQTQGWMTDLQNTFSGYQNLLPQVAPGFGALSQLAATTIEGQRQSAESTLRGELGRRQMLGSSFAQDTLSRQNSDYAYQSFAAQANAKIQELNMTQSILGAMGKTSQDALNFELNQMAVAGDIANKVSSIGASLANTQMQLQQANQAALGAMVGQGASDIMGSFGGTGGLLGAGSSGGYGASQATPTNMGGGNLPNVNPGFLTGAFGG